MSYSFPPQHKLLSVKFYLFVFQLFMFFICLFASLCYYFFPLIVGFMWRGLCLSCSPPHLWLLRNYIFFSREDNRQRNNSNFMREHIKNTPGVGDSIEERVTTSPRKGPGSVSGKRKCLLSSYNWVNGGIAEGLKFSFIKGGLFLYFTWGKWWGRGSKDTDDDSE